MIDRQMKKWGRLILGVLGDMRDPRFPPPPHASDERSIERPGGSSTSANSPTSPTSNAS